MLDSPAGVLDFSERYPTLGRMGAFTLYGSPVNGVGGIRELVAQYSQQIAFLNPLLKYGIELSISNLIGANGLKPQPRINARALGISDADAEALSEQFEELFADWSASACDPAGVASFAGIVSTAIRRSFDHGEMIIGFNYDPPEFGRRWGTTATAIDPARIARTGGTSSPNQILQGIELDDKRRPIAVWIFPTMPQYGFQQAEITQGIGERFPFRTPWGRHLIVHSILDRLAPGVVRGVSPIASALERAFRLDSLSDLTIRQMAAQLAVAWALVTEYDATEAAQALPGADPMERVHGHLQSLDAHFSALPLNLPDGAKAAILPKGSKLTATGSNNPTSGYDTFTKRLQTELARAFAVSYSELTGDYSGDNFSSAKMSSEGPWSIVYRRRNEFAVPVFQAAYENVIEEAFNRGYFALPKGVSFYEHKALLTACSWQGPVKPIVDILKDATANDIELANGSTSLAQIAHERGFDWREVLKQRAREKAFADQLGITLTNNSQVVIKDISHEQQ